MLKKSLRLSTEQVSAVMEKGKDFHSPLFTLRLLVGQKNTGFAAVMSKKIGKTAVARNLARRRVYSAMEAGKLVPIVKDGMHVALLCKDKVVDTDLTILSADLRTLFKKASVL